MRIKGFKSPVNAKTLKSFGIAPLSFDVATNEVIMLESRDPFDLMLVAQAKSRGMKFVTADMQILRSKLDFVLDVTD
jgi:PIN domain nuclease of toxin-antitoxin system